MLISSKAAAAAVLVVTVLCFGTYQVILGQLANNSHEVDRLRQELDVIKKELQHFRAALAESAVFEARAGLTQNVDRDVEYVARPTPGAKQPLLAPESALAESPAIVTAAPESRDFHGLTLWIVPHSHTDPGWHKTVEGYYRDQVAHILTSVMNALKENKERRFSWVEVCFFARWWRDQNATTRDLVRRLYRTGQLEFVMGGWVSNDEATVTYIQSVQQMTEGHRWLQENVAADIVPRVAWQIDPFGLSNGMAYIFGEMGLDQEVSWRITEDELAAFLQHKESEFVWEGHRDLGEDSRVLLHLLPHREYGYGVPLAFFFDQHGRLPHTEERVAELANQLV